MGAPLPTKPAIEEFREIESTAISTTSGDALLRFPIEKGRVSQAHVIFGTKRVRQNLHVSKQCAWVLGYF
jgi:hypothetical protein